MLLTRAPADNRALAAALAKRGAETVELPCARVEHLADASFLATAVRSLGPEDRLVLTSRAGVDAVLRAVRPDEIRAPVAAVGEATARRCAEAGLAASIAGRPDGETLGRELPLGRGAVLLARADRAAPALVRELRARGARVREVVAYRVVASVEGDASRVRQRLARRDIDAVVLFSPAAVDGLADAVGDDMLRITRIVAAGRTTAARVRERLGVEPVVARSPSDAAVIEAVDDLTPQVVDAAR